MSSSGTKGLSCLQSLQQKLEQDQARSRLMHAPSPSAPATATSTASGSTASREDAHSEAAESKGAAENAHASCAYKAMLPPAAGGAVKAASFLKTVDCGRAVSEDAQIPVSVDPPQTTVDAAVTHPAKDAVPLPSAAVVPHAPAGSPTHRPAPCVHQGGAVQQSCPKAPVSPVPAVSSSGPVPWVPPVAPSRNVQPQSAIEFRSNPDNFTHILRFMREGSAWKAPDNFSAQDRENLRQEALYFGCMALVGLLDQDGSATAATVPSDAGATVSAMAADLADIKSCPAEVAC